MYFYNPVLQIKISDTESLRRPSNAPEQEFRFIGKYIFFTPFLTFVTQRIMQGIERNLEGSQA